MKAYVPSSSALDPVLLVLFRDFPQPSGLGESCLFALLAYRQLLNLPYDSF
jgi:hypothetical protein